MKRLIVFSIALIAMGSAVFAELISSNTISIDSKEHVEVRDYKSFLEYYSKEMAGINDAEVNVDKGEVKNVLKKMKIDLSPSKWSAHSTDSTKLAYKSQNKKSIAIVDAKLSNVEMYNAKGERLARVPYSTYPEGVLVFSSTRLFSVRGCFGWTFGFQIFDLAGKLVKDYGKEYGVCGEYFTVSNTQKYFALIGCWMDKGTDEYLILYDMDGNELWRHEVVNGRGTEILFSLDDKYAAVKFPGYWETDKSVAPEKVVPKQKKVYIFDIGRRKLISEENYTD